MGWKIVRDRTGEWGQAHGITGQWRVSADPAAGLRKKILEEAGEYVEQGDPGELYDLLDVVQELITLEDPHGEAGRHHAEKVSRLGGFGDHIEWSPVPLEYGEDWWR